MYMRKIIIYRIYRDQFLIYEIRNNWSTCNVYFYYQTEVHVNNKLRYFLDFLGKCMRLCFYKRSKREK